MSTRLLRRAGIALALMLLAGCASTGRLPDLPPQAGVTDIHALIRAEDAEDARFQVITDRPFLQIDLAHRYRMPAYDSLADAPAKRAFIRRFVEDAAAIGEDAVAHALARVPEDAILRFADTHGVTLDGGTPREALLAAFTRDHDRRRDAELARIDSLADAALLDAYWRELEGHVESSIMNRGRLARRLLTAPAVPVIEGWIAYHNWHDDRGPMTPDFAQAVLLEPAADMAAPAGIGADDWALLRRHAPRVVQELADGASYPAQYDHFGTVSLGGTDIHRATPAVDGDAPALYAFIDEKTLQGRPVRQLVYVLWYPRHPKLARFDPEAGPLDGWTVRLSLDANERPVLVESVSNCGCYYKIFPGAELEAKATAAFASPLPKKQFRLEQDVPGKFDALVPETVAGLDGSAQALVLYFSAGHHQLVTVRSRATATDLPATRAAYALHGYDELENLPFAGHTASLFGQDGLVRSAHRAECKLLTPSGLYHAGHPRQRETQMIYFDEADFDDPLLLEHYLRLPPGAFAGGA